MAELFKEEVNMQPGFEDLVEQVLTKQQAMGSGKIQKRDMDELFIQGYTCFTGSTLLNSTTAISSNNYL